MSKLLIIISLWMSGLILLSACNTVEGMGKDVERAGESMQDTSEDVDKNMQ